MASKLFFLIAIPFFITLPFFASLSCADGNSVSTICMSTPYPSYCKSILPNQTTNVYGYGRFSIQSSLLQSRIFLSKVDRYLRSQSSLSTTTIRALEDCRLLTELNIDFSSSSIEDVNKTSRTLPDLEADNVQTLLSAILTNQQTCLDGLQEADSASSVKNELSGALSNYTKLSSVSLALFTKGWVPKNRTWKPMMNHVTFRNGLLPLRMSSPTRAVYETVRRRKLLQSSNEITIKDMVIVSKNGSGNFTTINDAINAAPNKTASTDGYFLIYVTAGVYEEYVSIAKNKRYLLMIGDGINQTIITGNRSVVDGWTTFNSATFGKKKKKIMICYLLTSILNLPKKIKWFIFQH